MGLKLTSLYFHKCKKYIIKGSCSVDPSLKTLSGVYCEYLSYYLRVMGDEPQFIVGQGLLGV